MKNILVPTDFSDDSENALHFAMLLARKKNWKLIILHAFRFPAPVAEIPYNLLTLEQEVLRKDAEKKLQALCINNGREGSVDYELFVEEGAPVETILLAIEEKEIDLVIMGTKGETGLQSALFGSVAASVIENANCPVMAIPLDADFHKPIRKITYATDYRDSDLQAIYQLTEIAFALNAPVNILHVVKEKITPEEKTKMDGFMKKVKEKVNYPNLSFLILHGENVEEQLEQYINNGGTDMMVMATHHRTFFERMFVKSVTREVVLHTSVPLIAFHYNKKKSIKVF